MPWNVPQFSRGARVDLCFSECNKTTILFNQRVQFFGVQNQCADIGTEKIGSGMGRWKRKEKSKEKKKVRVAFQYLINVR